MEIYSAILGVMEDIGAIAKDKLTQQQGCNYRYRGVDDVMNALQPAMVKHGVFAAPTILDQRREERQTSRGGNLLYSICTIKYTFYAKDGSSVEVVVIGEGMDSGDKATNKAMSIAFKYACFQVFCIPTEEMPDPDAEAHQVAKKQQNETANELKRLLVTFYGDKKRASDAWDKKYAQDASDPTKLAAHVDAVREAVKAKQHETTV